MEETNKKELIIIEQTRIDIDNRTIYWHNDLDSKIASAIVYGIIEINRIDDKNDESVKDYKREPIKFYINSCGGSLDEMWACANAMLCSKTPVHTYCTGYCYSAGFKLFLAGSKRFAYQYTRAIYHMIQSWNGRYLDAVKVSNNANKLEAHQQMVEEYIMSRTKIPQLKFDTIRLSKDEEWEIVGNELLELGIATDMILC